MARMTCAFALLASLLSSAPALAEPLRYSLRTEVGGEYDSNVRRTETVAGSTDNQPVIGSPLLRLVFGGEIQRSVGDSSELGVALTTAGKLFATRPAQDENVAVVQGGLRWRTGFGPATAAGATLGYYDAYQAGRLDARDFRSVSGAAQLARTFGEHVTTQLSLGYRAFTFKPAPAYDFGAPTAGLDVRFVRETDDGSAEWELAAGAAWEARSFSGPALRSACGGASPGCGLVADGVRQRDSFLVGRLEVTRTGTILLGAGYMLQWNESNSFGQTLLRHVGSLRLTAPLFLGVFLNARLDLVHVTYSDPVLVGATSTGITFMTIEDENRNTLRAELSRSLGDHVQVLVRYALYASAVSEVSYLRQTLLLSLSVTTDGS